LALLPEDVAEGLQQVGQIRGQLVAGKEQLFESDVWLLTHPDLRSNAKVRACMQFLTDRLTLKQVKR